MRLSRLLATALAVIGVGLVSGAVTQVAALDGNLKRAAARTDTPPNVRVYEGVRSHIPRCGRRGPAPTVSPAAEST